MHPAFVYIVVQVLDEESRRAASHLPDPDPSVESDPRAVAQLPPGGRRSFAARFRGRAASVPGRLAGVGRRLASEG